MQNIAGDTMRAHFQLLAAKGQAGTARSAEEFYGFHPQDVEEMHFHKHGAGRGVWYRLKDDSVIDAMGVRSESDRHWYGSVAN
jgi:hypothetical protein